MYELIFAVFLVTQLSFAAALEIHDFVIKGTSANGEAPNYYAFPESVKPLTGGIFRSPVEDTLMVCSELCWNNHANMAKTIAVSRSNSHLLTFVNENLIFRESDKYKSLKIEHNFAKLLKSIYFSQKLKTILKDNIEKFEFPSQLPSAVTVHFSAIEKFQKDAFESYNPISSKLSALAQKRFGHQAKMLITQDNYKNFACTLIIASPDDDYVTMNVTVILLDDAIWKKINAKD